MSAKVVLRLVDFYLSIEYKVLCVFSGPRTHIYIAALEDDKWTQRLRGAS